MTMKRFRIFLYTLLAASVVCLPLQAVLAAMYKWVDEDGQTHYTEYPPPEEDIQVETIQPPPKVDTAGARKELEEKQEKIQSIEDDRNKSADEAAEKAKLSALNKANCDLARDKLKQLTSLPRVYGKDEQGNRVRLGEDVRQQRIAAAQKDIKEWCK